MAPKKHGRCESPTSSDAMPLAAAATRGRTPRAETVVERKAVGTEGVKGTPETHSKKDRIIFSLHAVIKLDKGEVPPEFVRAVNEAKAAIYHSVLPGSPGTLSDTKHLHGKPGHFSTHLNRKFRMIWAWTDPKERVAKDYGITILGIVASDDQNK